MARSWPEAEGQEQRGGALDNFSRIRSIALASSLASNRVDGLEISRAVAYVWGMMLADAKFGRVDGGARLNQCAPPKKLRGRVDEQTCGAVLFEPNVGLDIMVAAPRVGGRSPTS